MKPIPVRLCDLDSPGGFQAIIDRCSRRLDEYPDALAAALSGLAIEESLLHSHLIAKDAKPHHSQSVMLGAQTDPGLSHEKKLQALNATLLWLHKSVVSLRADAAAEAKVFEQAAHGYLTFLYELDRRLWDELADWDRLYGGPDS